MPEAKNDLSLAGKSTLRNSKGDVILEWTKTARKSPDLMLLADHVKQTLKDTSLPKMKYSPPKKDKVRDNLYVYPVGDHHLGMLSWPEETGGDYNIRIGVELLEKAFSHLLKCAEPNSPALIVFLGDFLHFDSLEAVTPQHRNLLDADSRFPLIARGAMQLIRGVIELCRQHHASVHVIVEQGNHDPSSAIMIREALSLYYSRLKSVTIDSTPGVYHYYQFGKNLIGSHHGDKIKNLQQLPLVMASDRPFEWGQTKHRLFLTGHVHKDMVMDLPGARVESVRILPPVDAYAHESGYRSYREMKMLKLNTEYGEVARFMFKPDMIEG